MREIERDKRRVRSRKREREREREREESNKVRYGNVSSGTDTYDSYGYNRKLFTHYSIVRLTRGR